jgi:hypothetical protein
MHDDSCNDPQGTKCQYTCRYIDVCAAYNDILEEEDATRLLVENLDSELSSKQANLQTIESSFSTMMSRDEPYIASFIATTFQQTQLETARALYWQHLALQYTTGTVRDFKVKSIERSRARCICLTLFKGKMELEQAIDCRVFILATVWTIPAA